MRTGARKRRWLWALAAALPVEAASAQPSCDGARSNLTFIQQRMAAIRADAAAAWGRMAALRAEEARRQEQPCDKCADSPPGELAKARAAAAETYERARREAAGWTAVLPRAEQDVALHCTAAAPPRIDPPLAMPLPPKIAPMVAPTVAPIPMIAAPLPATTPSPPALARATSTASIPSGSGAASAPGSARVDAARAIARGALALSRDAAAPRNARPIAARPSAPPPQGKEKQTLLQRLSGTTAPSTAAPAKKIARKQGSKTTP